MNYRCVDICMNMDELSKSQKCNADQEKQVEGYVWFYLLHKV